ncbi:hypothetical protein GCM10009651_28970 [Microbacterium natoriense]
MGVLAASTPSSGRGVYRSLSVTGNGPTVAYGRACTPASDSPVATISPTPVFSVLCPLTFPEEAHPRAHQAQPEPCRTPVNDDKEYRP